jgi:class 3 adenylate cyclase
MRIQHSLLALLLCISLNALAQKQDTAYVNNLLQQSKSFFGTEPDKAIALAQQAREIAKKIKYPKGEATALKNIGIVYYMQQKHYETLNAWNESLEIFKKEKDDNGIANLLNNIAAIYKDNGEDEKALEFALPSLAIAEKLNDNTRLMSSLVTIASIYHNKKDPKALDYLKRAEKIATPEGLGVLYGNIGEVNYDLGEAAKDITTANKYFHEALTYYQKSIKADAEGVSATFGYNGIGKVYYKQSKLNEAIVSHTKALAIAEKIQDKWNSFKAYQGIGNANLNLGNNKLALDNLNKALAFAEEVESNDKADLYKDLATAYASNNNYKNALEYKSKYADMQKTIFDSDVERQTGRMQLRFDLSKKEDNIKILTKEKEIEQQQKMGFAFGLGLILIIAVIIFRNYKAKVKTNKLLDKKNEQIEGLLLNILPAEVAKELQTSGKAAPKHHDDVAVLFTDFKGFTAIADRMTPNDLVAELNDCFVEFDTIIEKYGLEKIKTIGDAYMCAAGIPSKGEKNTYRIVKAAMEIQEWAKRNNQKRIEEGREIWDIRIGVHTGPLVAGVVGKKKYAYDIWGTTVNIASRVESNGEAGRVNLSAAAYDIIKEEFQCSYRGKINAKNIGDIDMYFVEKEYDRSYRIIGEKIADLTPETAN